MKHSKSYSAEAITLATQYGEIIIEVYPHKAPLTVNNFLKLVDNNVYQNGCFYRAVNRGNSHKDMSLIQGGIFTHTSPYGYIPHETTADSGILHEAGTVSMARYAPGTASSEFFICLSTMPMLDFNGGEPRNGFDGYGYASFGRVVAGLEVAQEIQRQPTGGKLPEIEHSLDKEQLKVLAAQVIKEPIAITQAVRSGL